MAAGGVVGARKPGARLSETGGAFARAGRSSTETGVAFAGEKWVLFVRFVVAEVLSVSTVVVQGCAVVMAVSCWPASVAAVVSLVSASPCRCALCAKKFALRGLVWARARKSSPCKPKMAEKRCFQARWASFFAGEPLEGPLPGELFRGPAAAGIPSGELCREEPERTR